MAAAVPGWPVYVLILLLPLNVYSVDIYSAGESDASLSPAFLWMILLLPLLGLHLLTERVRPAASAVTAWYCLYLFAATVTIPFTPQPRATLIGWGATSLTFLAYLYTITYLDRAEKVEKAVTAFVAIGVVVAVMGLTEFFGYVYFGAVIHAPFALKGQQDVSGFAGGLTRMHGFFESANRVGSYLLVPFGLSLYRSGLSPGRRIFTLAALITGTAIVLSLARSADVGLITLLLTLGFFRLKGFARVAVSAVAIGLLAIVAIGLPDGMPVTGVWAIDQFNPAAEVREVIADQELFSSHMAAALTASTDNLGMGKGIQNYDDWAYDNGLVTEWGAHSSYLEFLGETGLVGFGAQIMIIVTLFGLTLRHLRRHGNRDSLAIYLIAIYAGLVVAGILRAVYTGEYTTVLMGMIVMNARLTPSKLRPAETLVGTPAARIRGRW